jgi:hypothetical protein
MIDSTSESLLGAAWNPKFEHTALDRPARRRLIHRAH